MEFRGLTAKDDEIWGLAAGGKIYVFNQEGGKVYAPASDFIPVDAEIPGCPPRPSEILEAILAVGPQAIANRGREKK